MPRVEPLSKGGELDYHPLMDTESSLMFFLAEPAISTISFFKGEVDVEQSKVWLKQRLSILAKANPWLTGKLVKNKKIHKNVLLATPKVLKEEDVDAIICEDSTGALSSISTQSSYEVIVEKLLKSNVIVGPGYKLIGKDCCVAKFTLTQVDNGEVALIVSMTHAVADGHTYYKIMSMLSELGDAQELSVTRKHEFVLEGKQAIGLKEANFLSSFPFALCCIKSMLTSSKAKLDAYYIDEENVKEWKAEAKHGYISTNDILTSTFANATNSDILLMAINLRGRVKEAHEDDAGNYSLVVLHDKESAHHPTGVRQILHDGPPFTRKNDKLPGFFKTVTSKVSMITNWAFPFFNADLVLPSTSGSNISLELHLPIMNPKEIAFPMSIIFKPCHVGKLGMISSASTTSLQNSNAPLGEKINAAMFPVE